MWSKPAKSQGHCFALYQRTHRLTTSDFLISDTNYMVKIYYNSIWAFVAIHIVVQVLSQGMEQDLTVLRNVKIIQHT